MSNFLKKLIIGNPEKKAKQVLKPAHALVQPAAKRISFSELLVPPPSRRVAIAVVVVLVGLVFWGLGDLLPGAVSGPSLQAEYRARLAKYAHEGGYRAYQRRGDADELSSLYASLTAGLASKEHEHAARARLRSRETLWDVASACLELREAADVHETCRTRLEAFVVQNGTMAFLSDKGREPNLRAALLGALALLAHDGKLPKPELATWVESLHKDGGFSQQKGVPVSLMATWRAVQLLRLTGALDSELRERVVPFVRSCQAVDGGFSDRPQSLIDRAQRHAPSAIIPSLRGAHLQLLLDTDARAAVRYMLSSPLLSASSLHHASLVALSLNSVGLGIHAPWASSVLRTVGLLLALLVAPHVYANLKPTGEPLLLACSLVAGSVLFEAGISFAAVGLVAFALLLAIHLVFLRIPLNDTGEELLYVSIASAAGSAGLFFALGWSSPEVFANVLSLYVFIIWAPLCSYLSVYVACMFISRPNTYFVASTYAAWILTLFLVPFLLYRKNMLEVVVRLLLLKGHFSPVIAGMGCVGLFYGHAAALIGNSI